jgi:HK97 family phage portal protein
VRFLGLEITRTKSAVPVTDISPLLGGSNGWFSVIREPFTGAWQRNREIRNETILTYYAIYSCVTLIASDVSKCCVRLVEEDDNGIWSKVTSAAFSPVLRKPNRFQNRIKFYEQWVVSKLLHGNTYVLKERDARGVVVAMYILDPRRTKPLVTPDGAVYYEIYRDLLAGVSEDRLIVPASEIIHDVMVPLYHPLCGVSPLTACGQAAVQGMSIQNSSTKFFENGAKPGGVLTAPGTIDEVTAARFKREWEEKFSGANAGRVAVLGDGLKYESMTVNAVDAQLIEQLKWSAETVCSTFHVPAYKVGIGAPPAYNNIEALERQYYAQCLQKLFECVELCLDEGLGLVDVQGHSYGAEFDLDDLLRMDTATLVEAEAKAVAGGFKKPNEARKRLNLTPVAGGDTPYLQQQNYSLAALAKRDSQANPFAATTPAAPAAAPDKTANDNNATPEQVAAAKVVAAWKLKALFADAAA